MRRCQLGRRVKKEIPKLSKETLQPRFPEALLCEASGKVPPASAKPAPKAFAAGFGFLRVGGGGGGVEGLRCSDSGVGVLGA